MVPLFASLMICSSPDWIGDDSTTDCTGRISPRISSWSVKSPRVTSAIGTSGSEPRPTATNRPADGDDGGQQGDDRVSRTAQGRGQIVAPVTSPPWSTTLRSTTAPSSSPDDDQRLVRAERTDRDLALLEAGSLPHPHELAISVLADGIARDHDRARRPR